MVAAALAQGLTADMFLQLTTTLAHMSAINNNSNSMPDVTNDSKNNIGGNVTGLKLAKFDNGTFLNLERGHCPEMYDRKIFATLGAILQKVEGGNDAEWFCLW